MALYNSLKPERVFYYFEEICKIPHGSENTKAIGDFCEDFAIKNNLRYVRDAVDNLIIYKNGTKGYENADTIILQGHTDMVCQSTEDYNIDFVTEGITPYVDGDFLKAKGTTLGADNGIALAMIFAILESDVYAHPPIEAVLTTDEEIGMIGALQLDMSLLKGKKMINIDSEEDDTLTVSCAGGRDLTVEIKKTVVKRVGTEIKIILKGLSGGHSGVEIHKGRVNADILAGRILNHLKDKFSFSIVSINGGNKANAIANYCEILLVCDDCRNFIEYCNNYLNLVKTEILSREPDFSPEIETCGEGEYDVVASNVQNNLIFALVNSQQGVVDMSCEIEGLVETSLNLGILETRDNSVFLQYSFRSNKKSAIDRLEEKMRTLYSVIPCVINTFGDYPSWSYNPNSRLQELYKECYKEFFDNELKVSAIHAGLECGVFDSAIEGLDCISVGPYMYDVHTVNERLSISSVEKMFNVLLMVLEESNNS